MKFTKKSILALFFSIVFILPIFSVSAAENKSTLSDSLDANSYCVSLYSSMMQSFKEDFEVSNRKDMFAFEDSDIVQKYEEILPDEYAGAFIDDKNILHIKFVGESNTKKYKSIFAAEDSRVVYEQANVSLKMLLAIQDMLDLVMNDFDIASTMTDEINNGLKIGLLDMSRKEEIIKYLSENILELPVNNLFFEEVSGIKSTASAAPGTNISDKSSGAAHMTVGYNAYKASTGQYGVVTAGHGTSVNQKMYNSSGSQIGTTSLRQFSGTIDAAFVPYASGFTPIASSDFSQIWTIPMVAGQNTYKRGITSGYNTGTLVSGSATGTYDGQTFTNQVVASNLQQAGDSGGPLWTKIGNNNTTTLYGIATFADSNNQAWASYAYNINSAFGISLYK
jgi:hypothetical protein